MVIHEFNCERCGKPRRVHRPKDYPYPPRFCSVACLKRVPEDVFVIADCSGGPEICWLMPIDPNNEGYGYFALGVPHRIAWELTYGPIPDGLGVLHHCDVRNCINPTHLFLGTGADNRRDCVEKGRQAKGDRNGRRTHPERWTNEVIPRGEGHWNSKLIEDDVRAIREAKRLGETDESISQRFGISPRTVEKIWRRYSWQHVD